MDYLLICIAAFIASGLTFFSGFGLGTIMLPVFAIFFPVEIAIVLTAVVHFLNNIFKLFLVGRNADRHVVLVFGIPAVISAIAGAYALSWLSGMPALAEYPLAGKINYIMPVKLTVALLLMFFALFEIIPGFSRLQFGKKFLPVGGILSGFFGGLSGHQGALRSAFLMRAKLSRDAFIATGVAIACLIDMTRLTVYARQILHDGNKLEFSLIIAATLSAFAGAYLGNKLVKKITIRTLQIFVAGMIFIFSLLLGFGII